MLTKAILAFFHRSGVEAGGGCSDNISQPHPHSQVSPCVQVLANEHEQEFHMPRLGPAAKGMKVHSGTSSPLPSGWHSFTGVTGRHMVLKMTEPLAVRDNK